MARLQKLHLKTRFLKTSIKPLRERARFKSNPGQVKTQGSKEHDQSLRLARNLRLPHDLACAIHNANA